MQAKIRNKLREKLKEAMTLKKKDISKLVEENMQIINKINEIEATPDTTEQLLDEAKSKEERL